MKKTIFFLLFAVGICLILAGCKKQSRGWIVGEVYVYDKLTGAPMQLPVYMDFYDNPVLGEVNTATKELGMTDETGRLVIEEKVGRRNGGFELRVMVPWNYSKHPGIMTYETRNLDVRYENTIKIGLTPIYPFIIHGTNGKCFSSTDSVWIEFNSVNGTSTLEAYGCNDTTFSIVPIKGFSGISEQEQITFNITTKKNGVVSSYSESKSLAPGQVTDVELQY